jgi:hypothetical protein
MLSPWHFLNYGERKLFVDPITAILRFCDRESDIR